MLEDEADAGARAHAGRSSVFAVEQDAAARPAASSPAMMRSSVVLPEPDGPEQRDQFAGRDVQADVVERR